jgi:hypothetical protein
MNEPRWSYFNGDDELVGPFSKAALMKLLQAGLISNDTRVLQEGTVSWEPFGNVISGVPSPEPEPHLSTTSSLSELVAAKQRAWDKQDLVEWNSLSELIAVKQKRDSDYKKIKRCLIQIAVILVLLVVVIIVNAPTGEEIKRRDEQRERDRLDEQAKRDRENWELQKEQNREVLRRYLRAFPNGK